jgi:hypothetical protein
VRVRPYQPCPFSDGSKGCAIHHTFGLHDVASRRFWLVRDADVSGVSGTGIVAEGIRFSDDRIVLNWFFSANEGMGHAGLAIYDNIADCLKIHGHGGATRIEWKDE